jgi:hypothetical protein
MPFSPAPSAVLCSLCCLSYGLWAAILWGTTCAVQACVHPV